MQRVNIYKTNACKNILLHSYQKQQSWLVYGGFTKDEMVLSFAYEILEYKNNDHPDLLYMKQNNISVDDTRKIIDFLYKTSLYGKHRIVIINNIASMSYNAINAMLKIIEEPPKRTVIILMNDNLYGVISTIRSRCCKIYVPHNIDYDIDVSLYKVILICFRDATVPHIEEKDFANLIALLQMVILRIIKVKINGNLITELYEGEFLDLRACNDCIASLYKQWGNILRLSENKSKFYLSTQQVVLLIFKSKL